MERRSERWAHFRFGVIGRLLSAPPSKGELGKELERLSETTWTHPITGEAAQFGYSTIERWHLQARRQSMSPVKALERKTRSDSGRQKLVNHHLREAVERQYAQYPGWSYQLHYDNLKVLTEADPRLQPLPHYVTVRRFMQARGFLKRRRPNRPMTAGEQAADHRRTAVEIRSYEAEYNHALWHLDFHHGSRKVLTDKGEWVTPLLLGILDDRSRLCCHVQWYLGETTEDLVHGFEQAILKRGLPRALMTDNGSAMCSAEFTQGLARLSIRHEPTMPYSPYQNGKQEVFWGQIEGRLMAMLEALREPSLAILNRATQAFVEMEYHVKDHSEIGQSPLERYLQGPDVGREAPSVAELRLAFTAESKRRQRRSDGTISLQAVRYEVPSRFRHLRDIHLRHAQWDLSFVTLMDPRTGQAICPLYPLDRTKNADGMRRTLTNVIAESVETPDEMAPLLRKLMADYAATGLPAAFVPKGPS